MVIQKIFLELAILRAIAFITDDLFCGQRYEGEEFNQNIETFPHKLL